MKPWNRFKSSPETGRLSLSSFSQCHTMWYLTGSKFIGLPLIYILVKMTCWAQERVGDEFLQCLRNKLSYRLFMALLDGFHLPLQRLSVCVCVVRAAGGWWDMSVNNPLLSFKLRGKVTSAWMWGVVVVIVAMVMFYFSVQSWHKLRGRLGVETERKRQSQIGSRGGG